MSLTSTQWTSGGAAVASLGSAAGIGYWTKADDFWTIWGILWVLVTLLGLAMVVRGLSVRSRPRPQAIALGASSAGASGRLEQDGSKPGNYGVELGGIGTLEYRDNRHRDPRPMKVQGIGDASITGNEFGPSASAHPCNQHSRDHDDEEKDNRR